MSSDETKTTPSEVPPNGPASEGDSHPSSEMPPGSDQSQTSSEDSLAAARAEITKLRDQLLRTAADFDNYRKRTRREVEDSARRGREGAIKDLLPVFDNLERATMVAGEANDLKSIADGLRIVAKQFVDTLEKMAIVRIKAIGAPFDPSVHEAIQHIESAEHPKGVVVAEVQPGYKIGESLVRPAMVVVSRGPASGEAA